MEIDFDRFRSPIAEDRAKPFWALNGKLEKRELKFQIECMKQMGFGGAFLHSRTGLVTEYMSDEWMELIDYAVTVLRENGMQAYLYDEDRWPSGSCGGLVAAVREYRAKAMVYREITGDYTEPENLIALFAVAFGGKGVRSFRKITHPGEKKEGERVFVFFYIYMGDDSFYNGFSYVDTMNPAATARFLELTHERYRAVMGDRFGKDIVGIFTDEPHRNAFLNGFAKKGPQKAIEVPYTYALFDEFERRRGYRIEERLPLIWFGKEGEPFCKETYDLIEVEQELFLESYAKPYQAWCRAHNLIVTGHILHEDNLAAQTTMCGSVMRYYPYMDYPGMDNLSADNYVYPVPKLVSSVAKQLDKAFVLDELYAGTGWQMRFADYKRIGDWQSAGGVTLRCPHLSWYTMKGEAKRDYPASFLHQSGWYPDYALLEDYFSRMQYVLRCGEDTAETAIVNPIESTWGLTDQNTYVNCFDVTDERYRTIETEYRALYDGLLMRGCETDYIDEGLFAEYGGVEGAFFVCGKKRYRNLLLNGNYHLRGTTLAAIKAFLANGGKVIVVGALPAYLDGVRHDFTEDLAAAVKLPFDVSAVAEQIGEGALPVRTGGTPMIVVRRRLKEGFSVLLLNPQNEAVTAKVAIKTPLSADRLNLRTGEREGIASRREGDWLVLERRFDRDEELMLLLTDHPTPVRAEPVRRAVALPDAFSYVLNEPNYLVLDRAVYAIDGKVQGEDGILAIDRAVREKFGLERRHGEMVQPWFKAKYFPQQDRKFCRVTLEYRFYAEFVPEELFFMAEDGASLEIRCNGSAVAADWRSTKLDSAFALTPLPVRLLRRGENTLTISFDFYEKTDIEGVFLAGNFGVRAGERDTIVPLPERLTYGDLCAQGLPYYTGTVGLLCEAEAGRYRLKTEDLACALMKANGVPIAFPPYEAEFTVKEDGKLRLDLVLSRRNLFGCSDLAGRHTFLPQGILAPLSVEREEI